MSFFNPGIQPTYDPPQNSKIGSIGSVEPVRSVTVKLLPVSFQNYSEMAVKIKFPVYNIRTVENRRNQN